MLRQPPLPLTCQRWNHGRDRYRPAHETINPREYDVQPIPEATAKEFVAKHHYAHSYPAARFRVGLFHKTALTREALVGAAVFSVPISQQAITAYSGLPPAAGVELGRFCLHDLVPGNGETFFLARALRLVREHLPEIRILLSYSDPVPRIVHRHLIKPGHVGTIYAAASFTFLGRAKARTLLLARRNGQVISERALCKIRAQDRGQEYALRTLRELGAPPMNRRERPGSYLARVLQDEALFTRFRHPGNFVYIAPVGTRETRRAFAPIRETGLPYPKRPDNPCIIEEMVRIGERTLESGGGPIVQACTGNKIALCNQDLPPQRFAGFQAEPAGAMRLAGQQGIATRRVA